MSTTSGGSTAVKQRRYHTLDGLRGIAALLVAAFHLGQKLSGGVPEGYLAVDLFFALSGFVIALNYSDRLQTSMTWTKFTELRLVRLYPLYLVGVLVGFAKQVAGLALHDPRALTGTQLVVSTGFGLFMLPTPMNIGSIFPLNAPSWSLFMEIVVNILFAVVLVRISSFWLIAIAAASFIFCAASIDPPDFLNTGWSWSSISFGLSRATYAFPIGVLIWRHFSRFRHRQSWSSLLVIAIAALPLFFAFPSERQKSYELAALLIGVPIVLVFGVILELPKALQRPASYLGDISYAVYAIHWPLVPLFVPLLLRLRVNAVIGTVCFCLIIAALATMATVWIDAPARARISRRLQLRRTARLQTL